MKFSTIDDSNIGDHHYIRDEDECAFIGEKTAGRDYSFSKFNSLISNFKKKPTTRNRPGYHYKAEAIREISCMLEVCFNAEWLKTGTLVPIPGSKANDHIDYDDRMFLACKGIGEEVDVRKLVVQSRSTEASHESQGDRITVEELLEIYRIDEALTMPKPTSIVIVDDVLTAGTHYRAMHTVLTERFPDVFIAGAFVARRVYANPFEAFED